MTVIVTQPAIDIREVLSELHLDEELFESIRSALQPDSPIMTTPAVIDNLLSYPAFLYSILRN